MGPGMFDGMAKAMLAFLVFAVVLSAGCGACGMYVYSHYSVRIDAKVERKP